MSIIQKSYTVDRKEYKFYIYTDLDNTLWFTAQDIALILQYSNTRKTICENIDSSDWCEWGKLDKLKLSQHWCPRTIMINKAGLYALLMANTRQESLQFRQWLMNEVLRQTSRSPIQQLMILLEKKNKEIDDNQQLLKIKDQQIADYAACIKNSRKILTTLLDILHV